MIILKKKRIKRRLTPIGKLLLFILIALIIAIPLLVSKCGKVPTDSSVSSSKTENISSNKQPESTKGTTINKLKYATRTNNTDILKMSSSHGILIDIKQNVIVAEKKSSEIIYPASLTKVMTLLVAVENLKDLDETFTFTTEMLDPFFIEEASVAGFLNEETVPIIDLLYGSILPSGADATFALAVHIAGNEENFVKLMNKKVQELGLKNTHFMNCSGLHHENHYSTVHDIALIMKYAMENETCKKVLSMLEYTTSKTPQHPDGIHLYSDTFSRMYGTEAVGVTMLAGKTGYTDQSGNCLVTYAKATNGKSYILATAGASGPYMPIYDAIDIYAEFAGTGEKNIQPEIPTSDNSYY